MTVLNDSARDLKGVVAELERRLAERDSENAELQRRVADFESKLADADAQQVASSEVLQVINSSPGDLAPVFDVIIERAVHLCGAVFGALFLSEDGHFRGAAMRGGTEEWRDQMRTVGFRISETPVSARLLRGEPFVHIADLAQIDHPLVQAAVASVGARTLLSVPLRKDVELRGMIVASRAEVRPYSDKEIALLQNFAAQAVIAMENARLITETREALEQQTATAEVLQVINASPGDLAPVFDAMLQKASVLCEAAFGILRTWDGENFHFAAAYGNPRLTEWARNRPLIKPEDESPLGRIAAGEPLVAILDARNEATYKSSGFRAMAEVSGFRSGITAALQKDGLLMGTLTVYRQEVRAFTDKQIAFLRNFAAQAVIAMENARLITETREALEQQTATAEVLGVINSSPGDLAPVFNAILEKAMRLCEAAHGHLWTFDRELGHPVAVRGEPGFVQWLSDRGAIRPDPVSPAGRILRGEPAVQVADITVDESSRKEGRFREFVDAGGIRTMLNVALVSEGTVLGMIAIYRKEVRPFTDKQIALLQAFAAQAVIAMENARLITETREALEQQTATAEVLGVINSSPGDLVPVFDAMLEKAVRLCEADEGLLSSRDREELEVVAARSHRADSWGLNRGQRLRLNGDTASGRAALAGRTIHIPDVNADPDYISPSFTSAQPGTLLSVPLLREGMVLGTFSLARERVEAFTQKQIALVENFAAQAVIAMENARLITETREALEQQTATAEVLGVINASPGDIAPVFEAILDKAHVLCEAVYGGLMTFDGEAFRVAAARGAPQFVEYWRSLCPIRPSAGSALGRVMHGETLAHIADALMTDTYRNVAANTRLMDTGGIRTFLMVPLRKDDVLLGVITAYRQEVRPFTDKQIALLQNFAAQAVIAMENARLLGELRQRTDEVAELNRGLEARVAEQVEELGRVGRLKRFLAPQLAELIVSQGDEKILESHRREIVVVFCDLRGYTAFTETAEPEEVLDFLREYHGALGPLVSQFEGTLDQFSGDGIMVFFNDPVPVPDPAERAVKMAIAMRETANRLIGSWRRRDRELGFGVGIAQGYATLGQIGFADRSGYTAIGTVCNLAARLCAEAKDGQILVSGRVASAVEETTALEDIGPLVLKGLTQPVSVFNVKGLTAG